MSVEKFDLTCPKCGGNMEPDRAKGSLHCPYCGHDELLAPSGEEAMDAKADILAHQSTAVTLQERDSKTKK